MTRTQKYPKYSRIRMAVNIRTNDIQQHFEFPREQGEVADNSLSTSRHLPVPDNSHLYAWLNSKLGQEYQRRCAR